MKRREVYLDWEGASREERKEWKGWERRKGILGLAVIEGKVMTEEGQRNGRRDSGRK